MDQRTKDEPRADPLLSVNGLSVVFDGAGTDVRAADAVSFEVRRGETVALVGESGCGKSVTALALMRLLPRPGRISAGRVTFDGRDLLQLPEREMRHVRGRRLSLVFPESGAALNPVFTIGDQVAEALIVHGEASRSQAQGRVLDLLREVAIADAPAVARAYPHQLSGGMRQRVLIAIAIACRPSLVIADEPTTALDATTERQILDLLRTLKVHHGLSLLLITHDLGVVAGLADRALVMYAGRIVERAAVATIFGAPAHPYTKGLLRTVMDPPAGHPLPVIDGSPPDPRHLPPGCAFAPRCGAQMARCAAETPAAVTLDAGHEAACHLYGREIERT